MKKRFTIQITIMVSFLMVLIIACGSIIYYNFSKTSQAFMDDLETDIHGNTEIIVNNIQAYLLPAKISTQFLAWFSKRDNTVLDSSEDVVFQSIKLLNLYPQIAGFFNGDSEGNFLAIRRVTHPTTYTYNENRKLPPNAAFSIRTINRSVGVITEFQKFVDSEGRTVAVEERPRSDDYFDPRKRPWYLAAETYQRSVWSDPYQFKLSHTIGITAATPVLNQDKGVRLVMSADMTLDVISDLMKDNKIGKTGRTFILDENGGVVGYPNLKDFQNSDASTLPNYQDINDPVLAKAYEHYRVNKQHAFTVTHDRVDYLIRFNDFGESLGKKWALGFVVPEHELTGPVTEMTTLMLIFSIFIVVVSIILIFLLSKNIARPIRDAAKSMELISKFHIDDQVIETSNFTEIQIMNDALRKMQQSLRDFSRFVPKAVVSKLIESGSGAQIGGKKRDITLMFTDIKDFSTISEQMSSEKLIKHLSDYLNQMTLIIQEEHGTIDKYIGDAIMTFWGAPVDDPSHPLLACKAALRCHNRLEALNKTWKLDGKPAFETRFGLHTGDAIVGNVGSEDRLNYSAFGDSVNLAARLESANRYYGTSILISHETYKNVRHQFICRPIDIVAVKGKNESITMYELMIEKSEEHNQKLDLEAAEAICEKTTQAFELYKAKNWSKAIKAYEELKAFSKKDIIANVFIERCEHFKKNPPATDWNGTWVMKNK